MSAINDKKGVKGLFPYPTPTVQPEIFRLVELFPRPYCLYLTWINLAYSFKHTYWFIFSLPIVLVFTTIFLRLTTLLSNLEF
jgi:hypothetical protein